jgi:hypothetical protein
MNTTALFVELLVIGLGALTWLAFLICSLFGVDWMLQIEMAFEKASVFTAVFALGIAYLAGIIIDEVCDSLIEPWAVRIRSSVRKENMPEMWDVQAYVFSQSKEEITHLSYMRSRLRIIRSSIFNMAGSLGFRVAKGWTPQLVGGAARRTRTSSGLRCAAHAKSQRAIWP